MNCKYLSKKGAEAWYTCTKTGRRCAFQRFCTTKGCVVVEEKKCPIYKNNNKDKTK